MTWIEGGKVSTVTETIEDIYEKDENENNGTL